ncbi:TIGR00366 family protein [Pseudoalteromonas sp. MMG006]|nr:TIGR00366 family protein [Pseudoalteromonas sp. MMG006]
MLNKIATPFTKLVERDLPDPFIFVILLSIITLLGASLFTPSTSIEVINAWGSGFWNLLSFAMQMLLVLITGYMLASTSPINKLLEKLATLANTAPKAIILVTLISLLAS